jgi:hypothetical protein
VELTEERVEEPVGGRGVEQACAGGFFFVGFGGRLGLRGGVGEEKVEEPVRGRGVEQICGRFLGFGVVRVWGSGRASGWGVERGERGSSSSSGGVA